MRVDLEIVFKNPFLREKIIIKNCPIIPQPGILFYCDWKHYTKDKNILRYVDSVENESELSFYVDEAKKQIIEFKKDHIIYTVSLYTKIRR